MKTQNDTQTQPVMARKSTIPQNSDQAKRLLAQKAKLQAKADIAAEAQPEATKPTVKKEPKVRAESNEAAAERMLKEKASNEEVLKYYTKYYKAHGQNDAKWIEKRASIYMSIALRRAEAKKAASVKK
jgi:hypothetical protein